VDKSAELVAALDLAERMVGARAEVVDGVDEHERRMTETAVSEIARGDASWR
jgi:hypothetical protein